MKRFLLKVVKIREWMKLKKMVLTMIFFAFSIAMIGCGSEKEIDNSISIESSSGDFIGGDYKEVIKELEVAGFTNIETKKIPDLVVGWLTKDGEVEEISIGENNAFERGDKFPKDTAILITYHTFEIEQSSANSDEIELPKLFIITETEVEAQENNTVILKGKTNPGAKVTNGMGIIGDQVIADDEGNFTIEYELKTPEKTIIKLNAKLDGEKESIEISVNPNPTAVKEYKNKKTQESIEREKAQELENKKNEEANMILTKENNEDFAHILSSQDDYDAYKKFVDDYMGRTIEFDGNIASMSKHGKANTRFDFLIYAEDYNVDSSVGAPFQFRDKNYYDLELTGDNIPEYITEGENLHIIAKITEYWGDLIILEPIEIQIR